MIAAMITTLFVASAALALGVIGDSWRRHGGAYAVLRQELAACARVQEFRHTLVTIEVRSGVRAQPRPAISRQSAWSLPLQPVRLAA